MEIDHKVQTITYGLRLCEYFYILQMVLRHCDVGGVYHWYVEQCLELPSGHGTQRFDYNMSFIWQLSLSKTIVDSLTLKIPGRILRFSDNGSDEIVQIFTCKTRMKRQTCYLPPPTLFS